MPSTLRWLLIHTSTPRRTSSAAMSAWMSEKPTTKSGCSARIASILALVKALTFGFSLRARGGRTVKPLMPTMRSCSPSAYSTSVGSSVRQTMRRGPPLMPDACRDTPCARCAPTPWAGVRPAAAADACRPRNSRIEHPLAALPGKIELVQPALVQAELRAIPELDPVGAHPQAGPARRTRHLAAGELGLQFGHALLEGLARFQRIGLFRRPRAELAHARTRGEIGIGLGILDDLDRAFDPHLHAAAHARPVEQQRRLGIELQLAALASVQVRVEHEPACIKRLEQHGARRRRALARGGGQGHRGPIRLPGRQRLGEQGIEGG